MSLTVSNTSLNVVGNRRQTTGRLAFDSSYAFGGESLTPASLGHSSAPDMVQIEQKAGYSFEYDYTNSKVKVFQNAPVVVIEEKHTAVANLITLDYPAAWIMNVCQAGQNMAWGKSQAAATLAANTFCVVGTIADGVRTQLYTDGATDTVYVTYITQAWADLYALLVQEEAVTLATGANDLANNMMAFGFCEAATTGILLPVDIADTTATGEVGIKMSFATGALDINAAQNGEAAVVTYLKTAATGTFIANRYIADEDPAKAGADPYTQAFDFPLLVWCITGALTVNSGTTQVIIDTATTAAAGEASINWGKGPGDLLATAGVAPTEGFVFGCKSNVTVTAGSYIKGFPWEVPAAPLEVKSGADLSALSDVRFVMTGF